MKSLIFLTIAYRLTILLIFAIGGVSGFILFNRKVVNGKKVFTFNKYQRLFCSVLFIFSLIVFGILLFFFIALVFFPK